MAEQQREFEAWVLGQFPGYALDEIDLGALDLARSSWAAALSHAEGEAVDWDDAQAVCDLPEVHDCLQCFSEDGTGDNGTEVVRAVMNAVKAAPQVAVPVREYAVTSEDEDVISGIGNDLDVAREWLARAQDEQPDKVWDLVAVLDQSRLAAAPAAPAGGPQKPEYGDAYQGARDDLLIWKRRALAAEAKLREQPVSDPDGWAHIANEWADMAANGIQWLRNVRDGISTPAQALEEMEANCKRIRALPKQAAAPAPNEREIAAYREALGRIAPYPTGREKELGYTTCRRIAREALEQGDRLRDGKEGDGDE